MNAWKTAVLLMGPVLLLGGIGFYLGRKSPNPMPDEQEPLRVKLDSFKLEPITPREAEMGFDTKAVARYRQTGSPPVPPNYQNTGGDAGHRNARLLLSDKTVLVPDRSKDTKRFWARTIVGEDIQSVFLMRLRDLKPGQEVQLQSEFETTAAYNINNAAGKAIRRTAFSAKTTARLRVRRAGEKVVLPRVSRYCPIELQKAELVSAKYPTPGNDLQLNLRYRYLGTSVRRPSVEVEYPYAIETNGKKSFRICHSDIPGQAARPPMRFSQGDEHADSEAHFYLASDLLPQSKGCFIETKVSFDDCWPLRIRVPVPQRGRMPER
jgi:hypothetical protein